MEINKEIEEQIVNFGAFGYDSQKIANILGLTKDEIDRELKKTSSELNRLLQKGKDMSDYVIDLKLFDLAKNGDIKALEKLDLRKKLRK